MNEGSSSPRLSLRDLIGSLRGALETFFPMARSLRRRAQRRFWPAW